SSGPSLHLDIGSETLTAAFATEAAFLVAAERRARVELVERVAPDDAGLQLRRHVEDLRALVGPDAGGEAVHRVVRFLDRFVRRAERHDRQDRAEDLFARHAARHARTREER